MGEAAGSIDDLVVELNDDMGNITIESEENALLRTFDNPFQFKCNFCDFQAKSERGLKSHKTRKHENCDWCEFICDSNSEMKKHKMDKHTIAYINPIKPGGGPSGPPPMHFCLLLLNASYDQPESF